MENDVIDREALIRTSETLTPSEANAMLDAWRAAFPEVARYGEQVKLALVPKVRYAEKGSALDRASRLWGLCVVVEGP